MPHNLETLSLADRDKKALWHPFTQAKTASPPIPIVRGEGPYLFAEDGTRYIDAISSWWVNLHGHCHPYIASKVSEQLNALEHVLFADFTHPQAVLLAERLLSEAPGDMSRVFFSDNGSTAVEVAVKIALQYHMQKYPNLEKRKIIAFSGAYHGDTFGSMSVSARSHFNKPFWPYLFDVIFIDPPFKGYEEKSLSAIENELVLGDVACFIFEPIVQGSSGMVMHSKEGLSKLIELAHKHNVVTIADEVMTGFGRCGPLFASELLTHPPKIMTLSKGITGGFLPLGATLCTEAIFNEFLSDDKAKAFLHGHSYTANPLACAAANASLDLLLTEQCLAQRGEIERSNVKFKNIISDHKRLKRCDVQGTIIAIEYQIDKNSYFSSFRDKLYHFFLKEGVIVRPLGAVLYLIPPYCISMNDLDKIYTLILKTLEDDF